LFSSSIVHHLFFVGQYFLRRGREVGGVEGCGGGGGGGGGGGDTARSAYRESN